MTDEVNPFPPCIKIEAKFYDKDAKRYYVYHMGIVDIERLKPRLENFQLFVDEIWPYLENGATIAEFEADHPRYEQ